ncbi:DUF4238 domain-containing protein [Pedobacter sp. Leaf194]|uniref:DUF4238 domain-containing protein n=1 Tax=Pedobacter sp. Leaf194 TaxID=1736297 RepID=UPI000702F1D9|nr:DUF4238 domain-containing protein [Pedobacter sp. Leaf194]KQS32466.1 hypothetical protein ASG14_16405 [Pedobacter sp. Leaf194]
MAGKKDFVIEGGTEAKELTRDNHYVPQWYQHGFLEKGAKLYYLDLNPDEIKLPDGTTKKHNALKLWPPSKCFFVYDLYTTFFGPFISDLVERKLFGKIDNIGAKAVKAFIDGNLSDRHENFLSFFRYIDAQKTRTPKGLTWLKAKYQDLDQMSLMAELEATQQMNVTMWLEGSREIVSAKNSRTKFILSDHPVCIYNYAYPPDAAECNYPNDPQVALKASQTVFPLDKDHCLILTNLEFAQQPEQTDPIQKRTNSRVFGGTMVNTMAFLRDRELSDQQVKEINYLIKQRARRYIAAEKQEWLYPEKDADIEWQNIKNTLLPPADKLFHFGGEMFVGTKDGKVHYQDAFGRTSTPSDYLRKEVPKFKIQANWNCPCGQGRKYKNCCRDKAPHKRPTWEVFSIRERNLILQAEIDEILGLKKGNSWDDVRRTLSVEQVKDIHLAYGSLWPRDTDILSLLPKSDGKLRAVYSGVIDVRSFTMYITTSMLYFDEIIIHHPFINPNNLKAEHSPVENPGQFRQHTLLNLALFFALEDYIRAGKILLVPDPGLFNHHLLFAAIDAAKARRSIILDIEKQDLGVLGELLDDDQSRVIYSLSPLQKENYIKDKFPDANENLITRIIEELEKRRLEDPLALLQDDLYGNGGQIIKNILAPNFEMSLFISQITGGIILTESPTRWEEFIAAQFPHAELSTTKWTSLIGGIQQIDFPFNCRAASPHVLLRENCFGLMKKAWQEIYDAVICDGEIVIETVTEKLLSRLSKACEEARKEMDKVDKKYPDFEIGNYQFDVSFSCIIPEGGISNRQVQRFLLTSGLDEYAKKVPMAIFISLKHQEAS